MSCRTLVMSRTWGHWGSKTIYFFSYTYISTYYIHLSTYLLICILQNVQNYKLKWITNYDATDSFDDGICRLVTGEIFRFLHYINKCNHFLHPQATMENPPFLESNSITAVEASMGSKSENLFRSMVQNFGYFI